MDAMICGKRESSLLNIREDEVRMRVKGNEILHHVGVVVRSIRQNDGKNQIVKH